MSVMQGGPGLLMLSIQYMITGKYTDIKVSASDVVRAADNSTSKGAHYIITITTTIGAALFQTKKLKVSLSKEYRSI